MEEESQIRTAHRNEDGSPEFTNRLIEENSPYLLQHAHNPVNWFPWGTEAFQKAEKENKPVLLSVGYSTCHWCHVMEHESFEDLEIAEFMNENYVCIKVDREERPDIDATYMTVVQMLTGQGGWPMTVWLTPKKEPFYGGTYFPPKDGDRGARAGFLTVLKMLADIYRDQPADIQGQTASILSSLKQNTSHALSENVPSDRDRQLAYTHFQQSFDPKEGGFGHAPKFPRPVGLGFLFRHGREQRNEEATGMALKTLEAMALGGIYDQVGGGFCRYSTDSRWLVPHFEKMLYDNAQLVSAYVDAYQITGDDFFAWVAKDILAYLQREMSSPEGGFYSATDADSEGMEGKFFLWSKKEFQEVLSEDEVQTWQDILNICEEGHFEGLNIPHMRESHHDLMKKKGWTRKKFYEEFARVRKKLYRRREERVHPGTDDKILASWNGLLLQACVKAGTILGETQFLTLADRVGEFLWDQMVRDGRLCRSFRKGQLLEMGFLDDYAFVIQGFLSMAFAGRGATWLDRAIQLDRVLAEEFWDEKDGGFFLSSRTGEDLLMRDKPFYDGAEPSGNSMMAMNLFQMAAMTGDPEYSRRGRKLMQAFGKMIRHAPHAVPFLFSADHQDRENSVLLMTSPTAELLEPYFEVVRKKYLPEVTVIPIIGEKELAKWKTLAPWLSQYKIEKEAPVVYLCRGQKCELPARSVEEMQRQLKDEVT